MPATFTLNTADAEEYFASWRLDISVIITMNRKTARVSAMTCKHVKLEIIYHLIIKTWCTRTASDLSECFIDFEDTIDYDVNNDKLNDALTKLICKGEITTQSGTRFFASEENGEGWEDIFPC